MAISPVQDNAVASESATGATVTVTLGSNTTLGNDVVVWVVWNSTSSTITSVTGPGTFLAAISQYVNVGDGVSIQGFRCDNVTSATTSVSVTFSAAPSIYMINASEWSGCSATQPDVSSPAGRYQTGMGSTTDAIASNAVTTATDGAVVVAFAGCSQGGGFGTLNAGTGWTGLTLGSNPSRGRVEYKTISPAGSVTPTWTATGATSSSFMSSLIVLAPFSAPTAYLPFTRTQFFATDTLVQF